jgi:hypothetical protein
VFREFTREVCGEKPNTGLGQLSIASINVADDQRIKFSMVLFFEDMARHHGGGMMEFKEV